MQPLVSGPRSELDEATVADSLDLSRGALIRHNVTVLGTDDQPIEGESVAVDEGSVTWSYRPPDDVSASRSEATTDASAVRRRATLVIAGATDIPLAQRRFRIWTEFLASNDVWVPWHLGVFVASNPPSKFNGHAVDYELVLFDKTYRYLNRPLDAPITIAAASNLIAWLIADLTSRFGETAFSITSSDITATEAMTFDASTHDSMLAVYNDVLEAAAYDQLTVDEDGRPAAVPLSVIEAKGSETTYGPGNGKIKAEAGVEPLMDRLPNAVRFVARSGASLAEEGNGQRTVYNQSTGPASIDALDGEVNLIIVDVTAEDQAELDAIAAVDAQRYFAGGGLRFSGRIGLNPRHGDRDVVTLDHPDLGLSGLWNVTSWTFPLVGITDESAVLTPITLEQRVAVTMAEDA